MTTEEKRATANQKRAESMRRAWAEGKGTLSKRRRQHQRPCKCGCGKLAKIGNAFATGCYDPGIAHRGKKHSQSWRLKQAIGVAMAHKRGVFADAFRKRKEATLLKRPKCKCGCGKPVRKSGALYYAKECVPHYGMPKVRMDEIRRLRDMEALCQMNRVRMAKQISHWKNTGKLNDIRTKAKNAAGMLDHLAAKVWVIRDPSGKIYKFSNLAEWARTNQPLFVDEQPDAVAPFWKRIAGGFSDLLKKNGRSCSYKGWTAVSNLEIENGGADLLGRDYFLRNQQFQEERA